MPENEKPPAMRVDDYSLMYVSLIVDIEKVFGIEIKLEELEECLSVKKLIEIAQAAWEKK